MGLIESILTLSGRKNNARISYEILAQDIVVSSQPHAEHDLQLIALQRVNAIRGEFMLPPLDELPKGVRGVAGGCPIANGVRSGADHLFECVSVGSQGQVSVTLKKTQEISTWVGTSESEHFVHAFDHGGFPNLELTIGEKNEPAYTV